MPSSVTGRTYFQAYAAGVSSISTNGYGGDRMTEVERCGCQAARPQTAYEKPFALMARDLHVIRRYCAVDSQEEALLKSAAAAIVILPATGPDRMANAVAPGYATRGFMLPNTPLHHRCCGTLTGRLS